MHSSIRTRRAVVNRVDLPPHLTLVAEIGFDYIAAFRDEYRQTAAIVRFNRLPRVSRSERRERTLILFVEVGRLTKPALMRAEVGFSVDARTIRLGAHF